MGCPFSRGQLETQFDGRAVHACRLGRGALFFRPCNQRYCCCAWLPRSNASVAACRSALRASFWSRRRKRSWRPSAAAESPSQPAIFKPDVSSRQRAPAREPSGRGDTVAETATAALSAFGRAAQKKHGLLTEQVLHRQRPLDRQPPAMGIECDGLLDLGVGACAKIGEIPDRAQVRVRLSDTTGPASWSVIGMRPASRAARCVRCQ